MFSLQPRIFLISTQQLKVKIAPWHSTSTRILRWSENNFFFEIEKSVVLKTCQTGKIYEKNWFWRVATFGGARNPPKCVLKGKIS